MSGLGPDRLAPRRDLPPYTYLPGRSPHPISDRDGHSFGVAPAPPEELTPRTWRDNLDYLFGFDLYHGGYYWEAHETWEGLWRPLPRHGDVALLLQGLIKLAAAGVKGGVSSEHGVRRHAARAAELLHSVGDAAAPLCGVAPAAVAELASEIAHEPEAVCWHGDPWRPRAVLPPLPLERPE